MNSNPSKPSNPDEHDSSRNLKPGDTDMIRKVVLFSPSGALMDEMLLDNACLNFNTLGFEVLELPQARQRVQRFAGSEASRLESLCQAIQHSTPSVLMATRGGYGLSRLLSMLNFKELASSLNTKGHVLCGHSDVTSLQLALLNAGAPPRALLHGPMACFDFGARQKPNQEQNHQNKHGVNPLTAEHFLRAVDSSRVDIEWSKAKVAMADLADLADFDHSADLVEATAQLTTLAAPNAPSSTDRISISGPVWGGNLTLLCSLLGTPWMPSMPGGILVLEDVNEPVYKIERMLLQLLHAGVLAQQQAIVFGNFSEPAPGSHDQGYCLANAVEFLQNQLGNVPLLMNFPFGHCTPKACWFQGGQGSLTITGNHTARLVQNLG